MSLLFSANTYFSVKCTVILEPLDSLDSSLQNAESLMDVKEDVSSEPMIYNAGKTSEEWHTRVVEAQLIDNPQNVLADEENMSAKTEIYTQ